MRKKAKSETSKVGVHELKNKASQILKRVREKHETWTVTLDGVDVAIISPAVQTLSSSEIKDHRQDVLLAIDELAAQISKKWSANSDDTSVEAVRKARR